MMGIDSDAMTPKEAIESLKAAGWTQVQIAAHVSMTPANISRIVVDDTQPNYDAGRKLVLAASRRMRPPRKVSPASKEKTA